MTDSRDRAVRRTIPFLLVMALVLLAVAAFFARGEYPEGNYIRQQRSEILIAKRPELEAEMAAITRGMSTSDPAVRVLGAPDAVLRGEDGDIWAYSQRVQILRERAWFGLVPAGTAQEAHAALLPLVVQDGVVVHVFHDPHPDDTIRAVIQERWSTYHQTHPTHFRAE